MIYKSAFAVAAALAVSLSACVDDLPPSSAGDDAFATEESVDAGPAVEAEAGD